MKISNTYILPRHHQSLFRIAPRRKHCPAQPAGDSHGDKQAKIYRKIRDAVQTDAVCDRVIDTPQRTNKYERAAPEQCGG